MNIHMKIHMTDSMKYEENFFNHVEKAHIIERKLRRRIWKHEVVIDFRIDYIICDCIIIFDCIFDYIICDCIFYQFICDYMT